MYLVCDCYGELATTHDEAGEALGRFRYLISRDLDPAIYCVGERIDANDLMIEVRGGAE